MMRFLPAYSAMEIEMFSQYSSVKIKAAPESCAGWVVGRPPTIGEVGTVVEVIQASPENRYSAEKVNSDGTTDWLYEFPESELT
jgi:hypothetical protein